MWPEDPLFNGARTTFPQPSSAENNTPALQFLYLVRVKNDSVLQKDYTSKLTLWTEEVISAPVKGCFLSSSVGILASAHMDDKMLPWL